MIVRGKLMLAHRLSYIIYKGEIPDGMTIDHQCNNRLCVNPSHLVVATQYANNMRGDSVTAHNKRKTHCSRGHDLAKHGKVRIRKDGKRRDCAICKKLSHRPKVSLGDLAGEILSVKYHDHKTMVGSEIIADAVLTYLKQLGVQIDVTD